MDVISAVEKGALKTGPSVTTTVCTIVTAKKVLMNVTHATMKFV
jgi:hypothetical protein